MIYTGRPSPPPPNRNQIYRKKKNLDFSVIKKTESAIERNMVSEFVGYLLTSSMIALWIFFVVKSIIEIVFLVCYFNSKRNKALRRENGFLYHRIDGLQRTKCIVEYDRQMKMYSEMKKKIKEMENRNGTLGIKLYEMKKKMKDDAAERRGRV